MKNYLRIGAITLFLALMLTTFFSTKMYFKEKAERQRTEANFQISQKAVEYYATESGKLAARSLVYEVSQKEIVNDVFEIKKYIKEANVKPKEVQSFSQTEIVQEFTYKDKLQDSMLVNIVNNQHQLIKNYEKIKNLTYKDDWLSISANIYPNDSFALYYHNKDSIIQLVHWGDRYNKYGKKKPKWMFFYSKRLTQSVYSLNPHSNIAFTRFITVQHK